jgi:hypothetical protein
MGAALPDRAAVPLSWFLVLLFAGRAATADTLAPPPAGGPVPGPVIELAPEPPSAPSSATSSDSVDSALPDSAAPLQSPYLVGEQPRRSLKSPLFNLPREFQIDVALDPRTANQRGATVGGYGELTVNAPVDRSGPAVADLRRTVLFFGMNFTDRIRYFSEIEWEHAFTSAEQKGEIAVEQMMLDFMVRRYFNIRAGMSVLPIDLVNQYHEPSTFHGVERPDVDTYLVPSTWKQLLVGFYGAVSELRYQIYLTPGLIAEGFTAASGIRGGVQGNLPRIHDLGVSGRIDWAPLLGMNVGLSGYFAPAGQGDPNLGEVRVAIASLDGRFARAGFSARAQATYIYIDHVEQLNAVLFRINPAAGPVARQLLGGYVEAAYDLLRPAHLRAGAQLFLFFRYDRTNTQLDVPAAQLSGPQQRGVDRSAYVAGLTFKPLFEIAVKADYAYRHSEVAGSGTHLIDLALAYQF